MEMVAGLLEAATKTFEGTSRGGIGAGDAVATVGGAMDDMTARRDSAGSAELEAGNTSAPSSMRRSSPVALPAAQNLASLVRQPTESGKLSAEPVAASRTKWRGKTARRDTRGGAASASDTSICATRRMLPRMTFGNVGGGRVGAGAEEGAGVNEAEDGEEGAGSSERDGDALRRGAERLGG